MITLPRSRWQGRSLPAPWTCLVAEGSRSQPDAWCKRAGFGQTSRPGRGEGSKDRCDGAAAAAGVWASSASLRNEFETAAAAIAPHRPVAAGIRVCHRSPPPRCDPRTHGGTCVMYRLIRYSAKQVGASPVTTTATNPIADRQPHTDHDGHVWAGMPGAPGAMQLIGGRNCNRTGSTLAAAASGYSAEITSLI
jgi:hypothetical protein